MTERTPNLGLIKPDINEFYDIQVHNENLDKIDETLSGTLPISKGGTGATDSSKARENLGIRTEQWIFTLEDGSTATKVVYVG